MNSKKLLDNFANNYPNSWHPLDEERFKKYVISSFQEWEIISEDELRDLLKSYNIFSEEQINKRVSEYINYIELLEIYSWK
ncbi:MAG: hypothetical protein ACD_49C00022G0007 [uncultured bacterium (gcode 4)]|uniref:Uncharacterized protein n=1 Tax=uncultured bacterium (gcode 4) TaxID=1234023 RepID=K2BWZ2_9BACT|nr:MAG: hypothetical protein ACD_49C00022G0007 [uncultured bacterium (gcode 4)]